MKGRITVNWLAREINKYCRNYKYFWACGLLKESVAVWKNPRAHAYLNEQARIMADHYLEETA